MSETTRGSVFWAKQFGVSYRQVDHWCRVGVLGERLQHVGGSGKRRKFTDDEVLRLVILAEIDAIFGLVPLSSRLMRIIPTLTCDNSAFDFGYDEVRLWIDVPALAKMVRDLDKELACN